MRAVTDGRLELDARGAPAPGAVPRLPGLRNGLPLRRAIRQADRAVPRGDGADRRRRSQKPTTGSIAGFCSACFPIPSGMRKALLPARLAQRLGLDCCWSKHSACCGCCRRGLRQLVDDAAAAGKPASRRCPSSCRPMGTPRARVALFTGCVADVMFRQTQLGHRPRAATERLRRGRAAGQVCCGAIHFHAGASEPARAVRRRESGGLRRRRGRRDHRQRRRLRRDAQGLRPPLARRRGRPSRASIRRQGQGHQRVSRSSSASCRRRARFRVTATYHDACHLGHAQKIREAPRQLLAQDSRPEARRPARDRNSAAARRAPTT